MKKKLLVLPLLFMLCMMAYSQQTTVTGKVINAITKVPLVGASVRTDSKLSVTDNDGKFSVTGGIGKMISISYQGMATSSIKITSASQGLLIQLEEFVGNLDTVIVTGYQTQKKADLTGAVTVVDMKELRKMPNNNPIQALQGRIPGMNIYTDGSPSGSNVSINIRGIGSINGTNPLYVIDGVATTSGMHELNPNDIENIQVLQDASASSIYGSRASNGVIIITTKKGKKGQLQVTANARNSFSYYNTKLSVLDSQGYGKAVWQASANDAVNYGGSPLSQYLIYKFNWGQDASGNYQLNQISLPEYVDTTTKTMKTANTNWFKEISQLAVSQTYDLNVSRGTDKGNSMFSADYTDNQGIVKTTDFKRISARINTDYKLLNDKLFIGENFTINNTKEVLDPGVLNAALQALPVIPVHTVDGIGWGGPFGGMNDRQNPVRVLENNKQNHYNYIRLFGNAFADLEVFKNLHIKSSIGLNYGTYDMRNMQLAYVSGYLNNPTSYVYMTHWTNTEITLTNTANYKLERGKHYLDAVAGMEAVKTTYNNISANASGFASTDPNYMYLSAATGASTTGGSASMVHLLSYLGRVNYVFSQKYLASATIRYDGSSRFGVQNRFGLFPAFSLGWRINKEDFIKNNFKFISDLKLRYGWGKTGGQDNISVTANQTLYQTAYGTLVDPTWGTPGITSYDLNGVGSGNLPSGYLLVQRSNDAVKWEATSQSNLGLDFGFFNQKVYGSIDYYVKKTSDMLVQPAYIAVIGDGGNRWVNGASMENKGVGFLVGYKGKIAGKINFDIVGNIATYRNKVTKLPAEVVNNYGGNGLGDNILGHAWGSGYGYASDGLFTTIDQVSNSADQLGKGLGRIRYKDINGDGVIDSKDQTWIYNPTPDYSYGMNFSFEYNGFDLSFFFQGIGHTDVNTYGVKSMTDFWSINETGSNKGTRLLQAWSLTNQGSTIPALTLTDRNNETRFSTYFIENGAYLKLRNLQLGYTLPKKAVNKLFANNLYFYVSGQNLLTFKAKGYTGVDPETPTFGYPIPTMLTMGAKITF